MEPLSFIGLERQIVVIIDGWFGVGRRLRRLLGWPWLTACSLLFPSSIPSQHLHHTGEAVDQHLGGVAFLSALILPFASPQFSLHVDLGALLQVLPCHFSQHSHEHYSVPLGALLGLAGLLVTPCF